MSLPPTSRRRLTRAVVPALAAAGLAVLATLLVVTHAERTAQTAAAPPQGCVIPPPPGIGGSIALTNGAGQSVTEAAFAGRPTLVYFGFTHCPDICPTSMYLVKDALTDLGPAGADLQTALITLDPERDDPATMAAYAASGGFPTGLVGLSGPPAQVRAAMEAFGVVAMRAPGEGDDYNVNHTSFLYVMDGTWRMRGLVTTIGKTPQEIAACVSQALGANLSPAGG